MQPGGALSIKLADAASIENVVGTSGADSILGNDRNNKLTGAKLVRVAQVPNVARTRTQYVLLDFDTYSSATDGEHVYTEAERATIAERIALAYRGTGNSPMFDVRVARTLADIPAAIRDAAAYATIYFNRTPDFQRAGGLATR